MNPYDDLVNSCRERVERSFVAQRAANRRVEAATREAEAAIRETQEAVQELTDAEQKRNDFGRNRNAKTMTATGATGAASSKLKPKARKNSQGNDESEDEDKRNKIVLPDRKRPAVKMEQDNEDSDDEVEIVKVVSYKQRKTAKMEQEEEEAEEESYEGKDDVGGDDDDDDSYHDESDEDDEWAIKNQKRKNMTARKSVSKDNSRTVIKKSKSLTKNIELKSSVGKTREQLNHLKLSCMKDCKFGQPVVCQKNGKPYAIVLNDQWNDLAKYQDEIQEWYVGESDGRLKKAEVIASTMGTKKLIPLFHSFKKGKPHPFKKRSKRFPPTHIYYVGHFKVIEFTMLEPHVDINGKLRQCLIRMEFVKFDEKLNSEIGM